jgi:hypothetical protein
MAKIFFQTTLHFVPVIPILSAGLVHISNLGFYGFYEVRSITVGRKAKKYITYLPTFNRSI